MLLISKKWSLKHTIRFLFCEMRDCSKVVFSDPSGLIQHLENTLATVTEGKPKCHKSILYF